MIRDTRFNDDEIPAPARNCALAVVLSETLARQLFGTVDAVGRSIEPPADRPPGPPRGHRSHGRCAFPQPDQQPRARSWYDPRGLGPPRAATIVVRGSLDAAAEIRRASASLNSAVPIEILPMTQAVQNVRFEWIVLTWLMTSLAVIASVLSAVGVYGLVAFAAAARRGEFGIRMALGASPNAVTRLVFRRASTLAIAGRLILGLGGSYALAQALKARLVGVEPLDPVIWSLAATALVAIVIAASLHPARKAGASASPTRYGRCEPLLSRCRHDLSIRTMRWTINHRSLSRRSTKLRRANTAGSLRGCVGSVPNPDLLVCHG